MDEEEKLRAELQHVSDDMKQQAEQLELFAAENARYKECTGKSAKDLEMLSRKAITLEVLAFLCPLCFMSAILDCFLNILKPFAGKLCLSNRRNHGPSLSAGAGESQVAGINCVICLPSLWFSNSDTHV